MRLDEAEYLAKELMSDFGLYYWKFKFDRAKTRFGQCDEFTKTISLSKPLVLLNDFEIVEQVILHEIVHALVGCHNNHNKIFQQKAKAIGCKYINSYFTDKDAYLVPKNVVATCPKCGKISKRYRMPSKQYSCGKCSGGKFNKKYLLEFKRLHPSQK